MGNQKSEKSNNKNFSLKNSNEGRFSVVVTLGGLLNKGNFFLIIISATLFFLILSIENFSLEVFRDIYLRNYLVKWFFDYGWLVVLMCLLACGYLYLTIDPIKIIRIQKLRERKSYLYYVFWGVFYAVLALTIKDFFGNSVLFSVNTFFLFFLIVFYIIYLSFIEKPYLLSPSFGPDTASIDDDFLGFKSPAKAVASEIISVEECINVFCLCGGLGSGKSSFLRMIVESMSDKDNFLYTYISLTETNEAKDFSRLFNERWFNTIADRYPKINTNILIPVLDSVFRDFNGGILSKMFSIIGIANKPIVDHSKVRKDVLCKFGGIYDFKERYWIIVIDEFERAIPEEMYRVVEVIERFKNINTVLPIRLIFIIPFAPEVMRGLENNFSDNAYIFQTANFLNDNKTITKRLQVPFEDLDCKQIYVINELKRIFGTEGIDSLNISGLDAGKGFFTILERLMGRTPRFIKRCLGNIEAKKNVLDSQKIKYYTPTQVITLGYLITDTKYLFLLDFIKSNISLVVNDYKSEERKPGSHSTVQSWIMDSCDCDVTPADSELLGCLSKCFDSYLQFENYDVFEMSKTLDSPENLRNCFSEIDKPSYYEELLSFADLVTKNPKRFKGIEEDDFIRLIKFLLRTNSSLLNNPLLVADFERRLRLESSDQVFDLLLEFVKRGIVPGVNHLSLLDYFISDFKNRKPFIVDLIRELVSKDPLLINEEQFISAFKDFYNAYRDSNSFDLDEALYDIIAGNLVNFLTNLEEESFYFYKNMVVNNKRTDIGFALLDSINMRDSTYISTKDSIFWNNLIELLYEMNLSYYQQDEIDKLLDLIGSADIFNDKNIPQLFNFLKRLIFSRYFQIFSEHIKDLILSYGSAFYSRSGKKCDSALLVYNFLKVCFYGEKVNADMGYAMLEDFMKSLENISHTFDIKRLFSIFVMILECDNVDFDYKYKILTLFNSSIFYKNTSNQKKLWVRLIDTYYRVFEDTYGEKENIIYKSPKALLMLRDYLDPFDERTVGIVRKIAERGLGGQSGYIKLYLDAYKVNVKDLIGSPHGVEKIGDKYMKIIMPFDRLKEIYRERFGKDIVSVNYDSVSDSIKNDTELVRYQIRKYIQS